jgi:predicted SAM-dependent methyltransferase
MVEHLTLPEMKMAFSDWYKALRGGGSVHIVVPNMDFHVEQWLQAQWDNFSEDDKKSNEVWSFAGFWGWQRECDPALSNYNRSYWDVHKSGFNEKSLRYFLKQAGFTEISTWIEDDCHLCAIAEK